MSNWKKSSVKLSKSKSTNNKRKEDQVYDNVQIRDQESIAGLYNRGEEV